MCAPQKRVDLQYIAEHEDKFGQGVFNIIDAKGLEGILTFRHDWNEEAILQFYATCYFTTETPRAVHWMTNGKRLSCTFEEFASLLELDGSQGYSIHDHAAHGVAMHPKELTPLYPPGCATKTFGTATAMIPKYALLFKCLTWTIVPKGGDYISVRNFAIDLMLEMTKLDRELNIADFIFHEMRLASFSQDRSLPYGPFIQAMIEHTFDRDIHMDSPHKKWCPRFDTKKKAPVPVVAPPSRFERFMAKAQRSIFNMCKFHAQEVVTSNKFAHARAKKYKDRLRALGDDQVSDDEDPPVLTVPEFAFPEVGYEDFFSDEDEDDDEDDDDDVGAA
jgi:hypothetical protein